MPQTKIEEPMSLVHSWLEEFRRDKRAAQKAGADTEAGGDNTEPTTHPVMDADPQTEPAGEGARGKENTSDVKDQVGGDPITGQEDAISASMEQPSDNMGTKTQASDEVRGNVEEPKATKDGPAENGRGDASPDHPTSEEMKNQEKYSSLSDCARFILQNFATLGVKEAQAAIKPQQPKQAAQQPKQAAQPADNGDAEKKAAIEKYPDDFDNGFVAAAMILNQMKMNKEADSQIDNLVDEQIASVVSAARQDADNAIDYLEGYAKGRAAKQAAAEMPLPPEMMVGGGEGGEGEGGEGIPPEVAAEAAAEGEAPGEELAEQAAGEGAGAGAEGLGEALGGAGGGAGGEGIGEEDLAAIADALAEAGVSPEELEAAIAAESGAEMPPEVEKMAKAANHKLQVAVRRKQLRALLQS